MKELGLEIDSDFSFSQKLRLKMRLLLLVAFFPMRRCGKPLCLENNRSTSLQIARKKKEPYGNKIVTKMYGTKWVFRG